MEHRYRYLGIKYLSCIIAAFCLAAMASLCVRAEEYTYTVRFFAGKQGSIHDTETSAAGRPGAALEASDGEMLVISGLHYGDRLSFDRDMVTLNDGSKYYIKGIRESGKDNNTVVTQPSFEVTGDQDYVVAYGILGDAVKYTVNYLDVDGNPLRDSREYYGNVGDKAVVAYLYIDGYRPQAYNIGMTLDSDAAKNVIDFIYTRITNEVIRVPGGNVAGNPEYPEGEGGAAVTDQGLIDQAGTNFDDLDLDDGNVPGGGEDDIQINEDQTPADDGPAEYEDLSEEDTPLAGGFLQGDGSKEDPLRIEIGALKIPLSTNMLISVASVLVIFVGLVLLLSEMIRRKKDE